MSVTPKSSRDAKILKDTTEIAYTREYTWSVEGEVIKAYQQSDVAPVLVDYGSQTYTISLSRVVIDPANFWTALANKTKVTLKIRPDGTGSGKPEFVFSECVIRRCSGTAGLNEVLVERVEVEAKGLTIGTQT